MLLPLHAHAHAPTAAATATPAQVLKAWRDAAGGGDGKEVTPEDLRKVRVGVGVGVLPGA